ncbi:MAG: hypothetical protein FWG63_04575 [Defluviitaleaceae bacterium]|nr:hypothetical protein [Defluviitaleaceae bacterium]
MSKLMFYYFREKVFYYGLMALAGAIILFSNIMPFAAGVSIASLAYAGGIIVFIISFFSSYIGDFDGSEAKLLFLTPTSTGKFMASRYLGVACELLLLLLLVWVPFFQLSPVPMVDEAVGMVFAFFQAEDILIVLLGGLATVVMWVVILYFVLMVVGLFNFGGFISAILGIIGVIISMNIWQWVLAIPLLIMGNPFLSTAEWGAPGPLGWIFAIHITTGPSIAVYFITTIILAAATVFATIHILEKYVSIEDV